MMGSSSKMMGLIVILLTVGGSSAFTLPKRSTVKMNLLGGFFQNPFEDASAPSVKPIFMDKDAPFDPTSPEDLINRAKLLVASDLGMLDGGSLLDDDFKWIGATSNGNVLGKVEYLAAGKFFEMRTAFPDLDYRSHDYRLDELDQLTVRLTARTVANMRGPLRLRNEVLQPNGKQMVCPPEAISITFDGQNGKVKKICSGFTMDRLVGNTAGLCGVMAASTVAGTPPSPFEIYPATTVVSRFFARPVRQLTEPKSYLAPFPEAVMIQLTKGIVAAEMAALDADLLRDSFTYCGPTVGPMNKKQFVENYAAGMFGGAEPDLTHFRVDPYDPYRVWVDYRSYGEFEDGEVFETPPQAMSFTFDDDGFCIRITGDAVMDPSIGNTGGLGGIEGINYAAGSPSPGITTRPLPQVLGRLRKRALEPFTKIGVDEYVLEGTPAVVPKPPTPPGTPLEKLRSLSKIGTPTPPTRPPTPQEIQAAKKEEAARKVKEAVQVRAEATTKANADRLAAAQVRKVASDKAKAKQQAAVNAATKKQTPGRASTSRVKPAPSKVKEAAAKKKPTEAAIAKKQKAAEVAAAKTQKAAEAAAAKKEKAEAAAAKKAAAAAKKEVAAAKKKVVAAKKEAAAAKKQKAAEEAAAKKQKRVEAAAAKKQKAEANARAKTQKQMGSTEAFKQTKADEDRAKKESTATEKQRKGERMADEKQAKQEEERAKRLSAAVEKKANAQREAARQTQVDEERANREALAQEKKRNAEEAARAKKEALAEEQKRKKEEAERKRLEAANAKKAQDEALQQRKKEEAAKKAASIQKPAPPVKAPPQKAFGVATQFRSSRTIALPKKKEQQNQPAAKPSTAAPKGVPVLSRWKANRDGSVTGLITGSDMFDENERVTTSPIAKGDKEKGNVVQTQSGSKYFLN